MPTITLYVKDADTGLLNRAKKKLGDSMSATFIECVRRQLEEQKGARAGEPRKITLEVGDPPIKKTFWGAWLLGDADTGIGPEDDDAGVRWDANLLYSVARTKQGRIVVYERTDDSGEMLIFDAFDEMRDATMDDTTGYPMFPENVVAATAAALGADYEVTLDI